MKLSNSGLNFIKKWEGLSLTAYRCQAGVWTIGWGSTYYEDGKKVSPGDTITKDKAEKLLLNVLKPFEDFVNTIDVTLTQHQFDALVSFSYNVGIGALKKSTLLKMILKQPDNILIKEQFLKWNKVRKNGSLVPSLGLTNRRTSESNLYFS